jgi:ankyrin repeat protein
MICLRFLWAKVQLDLICQLANDKAIQNALTMLPRGLNECYDRLLQQVASRNADSIGDIKLLLMWIVGSSEPLNVTQFAEAIAIQPGNTFRDLNSVATDPDDLIDRLGSLVVVDHTPKNAIVSLAHFTLYDYLHSVAVRDQKSISIFYLDTHATDLAMAVACLQYIGFEDFAEPCKSLASLRQRLNDYPMLDYATRNLFYHLGNLPLHHLQALDELKALLRWLTDPSLRENQFKSWQQVYHRRTDAFDDDHPLFYAIKSNVVGLVELLVREGCAIPKKFKVGRTPLQVAAGEGGVAVIRLLLHHHPDLEAKAWPKGLTTLHIAAEEGYTAAVQVLLEAGASPHARNNSRSTPLYRAARGGRISTQELLYKAGSDVNAATWDNWTPIFEAIWQNNIVAVRRLVSWGADLKSHVAWSNATGVGSTVWQHGNRDIPRSR